MKKILTIQDISCFGKCSLTVALPIISCFEIETCVIPTAVLSTHTYKFKDYTFRDLTSDLPLISKHWQKEGITFDGIYTGYVASIKQIEYIKDIIDTFKKEKDIILVDPAMADNGKLYNGFDNEFVKSMKTLCMKADFLVPNITEAMLLLDKNYQDNLNKEDIENILKELSIIYDTSVILTGVSFEEGKLGVAAIDKLSGNIYYYFKDLLSEFFHGTGDIYASTFFASIIKGYTIYESIKIATDFTVASIKETIDEKDLHWYGVKFEKALKGLMNKLNEK